MGMSMQALAERAGVSCGCMPDVSRGRRNMIVPVQARAEEALEAPVKVEPAQRPRVDCRALWDRMEAHGFSQNEVARRAGISSALLSQIMNGRRIPSGEVLKKLHGVLFQPTAAELVVPAEVKVLAWKKGGRNGVVRGAGGPGSSNTVGRGTVRIGGRVPWGAQVEYAYRAGYDSRGRVSVTPVVDERGYSVMLSQWEPDGDGPGAGRAAVGARIRRQRQRAQGQRPAPYWIWGHRTDGRAGSGQPPPEGTRRRAADAVLLGRSVQGPQPEAKARSRVPVRVGADCGTGAGERAGRRGALGRNTQGEVVATSAMASPCTAMYAAFFAFQPARFMCAALFCCPFSGGALIPLLRSPSSASDGPSGEAAGMEANKRRLTLDLTSTLQLWLKVCRSRASACAIAVKPPSTGRPTKGEADTPLLVSPMRHSQHALGAPSGRYAVRPRLRARGFSRRAGRQGQRS